MRKLLLSLIFLAGIAEAQHVNTCIDSSGNGDSPLCTSGGALVVASGGGATATFAAMDATTTIGAAYASAVNLPDDTKVVILDNQTNGDVTVSMDGGTSDTYHLKAGDILSLNLAAAGLETTADVQIKDGTTASSSGTFYVYSIK